MLPSLIFIYFIFVIQTHAEDIPTLPQEALADAIDEATKFQEEANKLIKEKLANNAFAYNFFENGLSKKGCPSQGMNGKASETKGCVKNLAPPIPQSASTQKTSAQKENTDQILVFVSFSMPEASLKDLAQQTQQHNALLVMRGLYQDSFFKTAQKLEKLAISVDINPELFDTHHVTSVPTFVMARNRHAVLSLKGNVTLSFVAKEFNNHILKDQPNFRRAP